MGYVYCSEEERRLQKKLIPLNIFVAILSLVAAVSLIFTPLFKINIGKIFENFDFPANEQSYVHSIVDLEVTDDEAAGDEITDGNDEVTGDNDEVTDDNDGDGSEEGSSGDSFDFSDMEKYLSLISDMFDTDIVVSPVGMAKVLFAPEEDKGMIFLEDLMLANGFLEDVLVSFVNVMVVVTTDLLDESELADVNFRKLVDEFFKIDNVKSAEEFDKKIDGYIGVLEAELGETFDADVREEIHNLCSDMYNQTMDYTDSFSIEKMICVLATSEGGDPATSYGELLDKMLSDDFADGKFSSMIEPFNTFAPYYGYVFLAVAFFALLWFILFLFAFLRLFAKNKRFTMWYVKLLGCWPCLICGVAPLVGGMIFTNFAPYLAALSTLTWISGGCYLVLWAVSIFWAFTIKHKIRKIRK